jgi:hypothetical protein
MYGMTRRRYACALILVAARPDGAAKRFFGRTAAPRTHPGTGLFRQIQNQKIITHPHREWVDRTLPVTGEAGAAERIRTSDPRITNALLCRLSYRGVLAARGNTLNM